MCFTMHYVFLRCLIFTDVLSETLKHSSASLNVIVLCLVIFFPALFSPMLYCNIIPHETTEAFGLSLFSTLSLLFFSLITYFLFGRRHSMFVLAQVVIWPRTE